MLVPVSSVSRVPVYTVSTLVSTCLDWFLPGSWAKPELP